MKTLESLDARLEKAGHHPLTPFWRSWLGYFYEQGARSFVARVGRGGAKSHTAVKIGLRETLGGNWKVPPGERHYFCFVSLSKDEASQRLLLLESFLRALGVSFDRSGDTIALESAPLGFKVLACQIGSVSGFRCIGYVADEVAKWESGPQFANPAEEVCASLDAMAVTHPDAKRVLISSPWTLDDFHAREFERGNVPGVQVAAHAPSWIANPSIDEAALRAKHGDSPFFAREYEAIATVGAHACFDVAHVLAAFGRPAPAIGPRWEWTRGPFCSVDLATGKGRDGIGVVLGYLANDLLVADEAYELNSISIRDAVARIASSCASRGISEVHGDHFGDGFIDDHFADHRIRYISTPWNNARKANAMLRLRELFRQGRVCLPANADQLKRELLEIREIQTPSGNLRYETGGKDLASALLASLVAVDEGALRMGDGMDPSARRLWDAYSAYASPFAFRREQ